MGTTVVPKGMLCTQTVTRCRKHWEQKGWVTIVIHQVGTGAPTNTETPEQKKMVGPFWADHSHFERIQDVYEIPEPV